MRKIAAFHFKNCGRRKGLKNNSKSLFSMNEKFSMHFSKKEFGEKSVVLEVIQLLFKFGEHHFI